MFDARWTYPLLALCLSGGCASQPSTDISQSQSDTLPSSRNVSPESDLPLGAFSVSLAVTDLSASRKFYEALGFTRQLGGSEEQNYLILQNGRHVIGLFEGMLDGNILTFNPGWDQNGKPTDAYMDVREIQKKLKAAGVVPVSEAAADSTGPASLILRDPDGNTIFLDQHR